MIPDPAPRRLRAFARLLAAAAVLLLLMLLGPLAVLAWGDLDLDSHWSTANRASSGQAPDPALEREALIQVYGARTYNWRGAFGIHTWIAAKGRDADSYTVHQVTGWNLRRSGVAVSRTEGDAGDGYWFNARPVLLAEHRGPGTEALIDRLEAAIADYPQAKRYRAWPGPNSNTFTAFVARRLPELGLDLPPTAIGKDWLPGTLVDRTPSGTGWQASLYGLLGVSVGAVEGFELNLLGLNAGFDFDDLALRLPGLGRIELGARGENR